MSRIKVTYIAIDSDGHKPIMSAESFEDLKKGLDEYYAVDKTDTECLGFHPYKTKYPDELEGYYEYKSKMRVRNFTTDEFDDVVQLDMIKVYCVEFYPHTKIDKND